MVVEAPYECPLVGKCILNCGNGIFEGVDTTIGYTAAVATSTEECDDGNFVSGDGCSSVCMIETGWTCINKYIYLRLEVPVFRSFCTRTSPVIPPIVTVFPQYYRYV